MPLLFSARLLWGVLLVLCLAVAMPMPTHAADAASITAPKKLRDALQQAWQSHPSSRAAEAALAAAQARTQAASRPLYNPALELAADRDDARTYTLGVSQTFDISGKRRTRRAVGESELRLAEQEHRLARSSFARDWITALAALHTAQKQVQLGEQRVTLAERFAVLAERQHKVGDISLLERDLASLARDEAQAEQASLLSDLAMAQQAWQAVGGTDASSLNLELPNQITAPRVDEMESAIKNTPEWQLADIRQAITDQKVAVAQSERRADPTFMLRGGRMETGPINDRVIGVSVSVPLHVRNTYRAEVAAAQADALAVSAQSDREHQALIARAQSAKASYLAMQTAWARWNKTPGMSLSKRTDLLEKLRQAGELSSSDYLQQLNQTLNTALAGAALEGRLWQRYSDYLFAIGRLDAWAGLDASVEENTP